MAAAPLRRAFLALAVGLTVPMCALPSHAADMSSGKSFAVNAAYYGALYVTAATAATATSMAIGAVTAPAYLPVATALGVPAVVVTIMVQAVPWAGGNVPGWAANQYDAWFGDPQAAVAAADTNGPKR